MQIFQTMNSNQSSFLSAPVASAARSDIRRRCSDLSQWCLGHESRLSLFLLVLSRAALLSCSLRDEPPRSSEFDLNGLNRVCYLQRPRRQGTRTRLFVPVPSSSSCGGALLQRPRLAPFEQRTLCEQSQPRTRPHSRLCNVTGGCLAIHLL